MEKLLFLNPTRKSVITEGRDIYMSEVKVNNGNIEDALKRFKRQCARNGVLQEVRKMGDYVPWKTRESQGQRKLQSET